MAQHFPKTVRTHYRGCRAWTFHRFTNNDAAVSNIERQRHEICNSGHGSPSQSYQSLRSGGTGSNLPRAYQRCAEKHLHRYLSEFDFRYSNRVALGIHDGERADLAIKGAAGKRLTYRQAN
jgi:hypothetical protein